MYKKQAFAGLITTAAVVFCIGTALPVQAQMVPSLVYYPTTATNAGPCNAQHGTTLSTQRVVTYAKPYWRERVQREELRVYAAPDCSSDSLLYTLTADTTANGIARTIVPTSLGIAALEQQCTSAPWQANVSSGITEPLYKALRNLDAKSACAQMQSPGTTAASTR